MLLEDRGDPDEEDHRQDEVDDDRLLGDELGLHVIHGVALVRFPSALSIPPHPEGGADLISALASLAYPLTLPARRGL